MTEPQPLAVCEVTRRGKLLVGEPFFEPGAPITIGRRGAVPATEGDLAVLATEGRRGRLVEVLGRPDDLRAVMRGVLVDEGMASPWPQEVDDDLTALPRDPLPAEPGRIDLRDRLTFTIDPPDARDFDDAITVEREAAGLRVLVHIADVSAFVAAGSAIDQEAAWRGCSVYLPGLVEPMLPHALSSGLCSLQPDRDRYAVTVEIAPGGEATAYRSLIRSDHRLSYPQAERILAGEKGAPAALRTALGDAQAFAAELRAARFARGAARIESREVEFTFEDGQVIDAAAAAEHAAHALVEELMLLANEQVAWMLATARAPALYRVHEPPEPDAVRLLLARLEALEVPTPPEPELHTPAQAAAFAALISDRVTAYAGSSGRGRIAFPTLVLRALQRARYDPRNLGHSGLASTAYCHFTSPIRRYPDLVVHRALLALVGAANAEQAPDDEWLAHEAARSSEAERDAARIEHRGDDICLAFLLERVLYERDQDEPFDGEIVGMIEGALFVRFGGVFDGLLPARRLGRERFELDRLGVSMAGLTSGRRYRLGDRIEVRVQSVERPRGRVLLDRAGRAGPEAHYAGGRRAQQR